MGTGVTCPDTDFILSTFVYHWYGKRTRIQFRKHGTRAEILWARGSSHKIQGIVWSHCDDVGFLDFNQPLIVLDRYACDGELWSDFIGP